MSGHGERGDRGGVLHGNRVLLQGKENAMYVVQIGTVTAEGK